jgi:hypothetical protein
VYGCLRRSSIHVSTGVCLFIASAFLYLPRLSSTSVKLLQQQVSYGDLKQIVELLRNMGAEVNAQGGFYGNALQVASLRGDEQVVKMLLLLNAVVEEHLVCDRCRYKYKAMPDLVLLLPRSCV